MTFTKKKFIVKIYDSLGTTLKTTLPSQEIKNNPTFTTRVNGGFGQCVVDIQRPFDNFDEGGDVDFMNIVEIYEIDENNKSGRIIYKGFISAYEPYFGGSQQGVNLILLGMGSLLSFAYYKDADFVVTHVSQDPAVIMKAIIDNFNSVYGGNLVTYDVGGTTIDTVGTSVSYTFNEKKWLDSLQETFNVVDPGWWWSVDRVGVVYLKPKPSTATHTFTVGRDLEEIVVNKNSENVVNDVQVTWASGIVTDADATSKTEFGTRQRLISNTNIDDVTSANQMATQEVNDNKDNKVEARFRINSQFDLESIKVGDTCRVRNLNINSTTFNDNMLIVSVKYSWDFVTIELERLNSSFGVQLNRFLQDNQ